MESIASGLLFQCDNDQFRVLIDVRIVDTLAYLPAASRHTVGLNDIGSIHALMMRIYILLVAAFMGRNKI